MMDHDPMDHRCYIIPPHLLKAIAESAEVPEFSRQRARDALSHREQFSGARTARFEALGQPRGHLRFQQRPSIVPEHLLSNLAEAKDVDEETRACAKADLEHIKEVHAHRLKASQQAGYAAQAVFGVQDEEEAGKTPARKKAYRSIYTLKNSQDESELPGTLLRNEGQKPVKDKAANEAYDNIGSVLEVYADIFKWKSIDNKNVPITSTVHFGEDYENAFWDPERMQMVFGDGGDFIGNFTATLDVIGHEMTHAVTENTSPLEYRGQPGALNEHVSDVFGIMIKQWKEKEKAADADWLIGEGCLLPDVKGVALRSMKAPGTAYDDPRFGKDPQPAHFDDYKVTFEDNGGVHLYSGIPNRAFYLASVAFGGFSYEKAGQIWWQAMRSGKVPPRCTFLQFADVTVDVAEEEFGEDAAKTVRKAWDDVGVKRKH
jgi:Zn-dependent metalloprotease